MTENEAQKQSGEIISNALSAASEILNLPNRPAQDMIDISQRLADRIIQAAKELSGSGVKSAVNVPPESVNSSEIVSIRNILEEYQDNSIVAERKYEGKRVTVRSEIGNISKAGKGFGVNLYEEFYDDEGNKDGDCYIGDCHIYCYFDPKYENIILSLKKGHKLTVNGKCHCEDYGYSGEVELRDCKILSVE